MSIASKELTKAFVMLASAWDESDLLEKCSWNEVKLWRQYDANVLRITTRLRLDFDATPDDNDASAHDVNEDEDDEALNKSSTSAASHRGVAIYDIIHSPSYQVPVVYISFKELPACLRLSLEEVHDILIPPSHKPQMAAVGVIGALSMTEHPVTNLPVYFVHPCRTAQALSDMLDERSASSVGYLLLWFGMVGSAVGLSVPTELAQAFSQEASDA